MNQQQEKNEKRCKMFDFLDRLHDKYGMINKEEIKPIINKKTYKHDYYMRNKDKYKKSNV